MFSRAQGKGVRVLCARKLTGSSGRGPGCSLAARLFSSTAATRVDFEHIVIGAGAVGLATARALARRSPATLLLERHLKPGTETSSRNSEVIHAGIYYGGGTLKTELCIRGKELLYAFCAQHGVPHRNTGKWIVAQTPAERAALEAIHTHCTTTLAGRVPTRWLAAAEMARREPAVRAAAGCLESPTTGIVDSHALMTALLGHFELAGGTWAPGSRVVGLAPLPPSSSSSSTTTATTGSSSKAGSAGWQVTVRDARTGADSAVTAATVVNAAGLACADVYNLVVPRARRMRLLFAKGTYFAYAAAAPAVSTLVYPVPAPGAGGLGTHLTLDLGGRVRFGPDVEWVDAPDDLAVSGARLAQAVEEIRRYLPGVDAGALRPDYAGIRPKLALQGAVMDDGKGFHDFVVRLEEGYAGWVNLLGIESPGLTSCLAIGEKVEGLLYG